MTQEDRQLLLIDLCARLPYGVKVGFEETQFYTKKIGVLLNLDISGETIISYYDDYLLMGGLTQKEEHYCVLENIKPYLHPMSSMTGEEKKDFLYLTNWNENDLTDIVKYPHMYEFTISIKAFDWLNAHHFDYRGLIERGLAIEVTKENNPYE